MSCNDILILDPCLNIIQTVTVVLAAMTPGGFTPSGGGFTPSDSTPIGKKAMDMATPTPGHLMSMTPEQMQAWTLQKELDERNRPLGDEELDAMLPPGFKV